MYVGRTLLEGFLWDILEKNSVLGQSSVKAQNTLGTYNELQAYLRACILYMTFHMVECIMRDSQA